MNTHTLTALIRPEGDLFVAQCLEDDVASQGPTRETAKEALAEALTLKYANARLLPAQSVLEKFTANFSGHWFNNKPVSLFDASRHRSPEAAQDGAQRRVRVTQREAWWTDADSRLWLVTATRRGNRHWTYHEVEITVAPVTMTVAPVARVTMTAGWR